MISKSKSVGSHSPGKQTPSRAFTAYNQGPNKSAVDGMRSSVFVRNRESVAARIIWTQREDSDSILGVLDGIERSASENQTVTGKATSNKQVVTTRVKIEADCEQARQPFRKTKRSGSGDTVNPFRNGTGA